MSMVGLKLLAAIDQRLRQAWPERQQIEFGGVIFYLFGDFNQLSPVGDTSLVGKANAQNIAALRGKILFENFKKVFILKSIMRQIGNDQQDFRNVLANIGNGQISEEDYRLIQTRFYANVLDRAEFHDALRIKATKEEVATYNETRLRALNLPVARIRAKHNNATAELGSTDDAQGLQLTLLVAVVSRVMLTQNLWTACGLCNGSIGTITDVIYAPSNDGQHLNEHPLCILVKFDAYTGPTLIDDSIPIVPQTVRFKKNNVSCMRKQFPLRSAYAITVHRSQGITVSKAVIDIGNSEFGLGLTYVAMSRVKSIQGVLIEPGFAFNRLLAINKHKSWIYRRPQMQKLIDMSNN